MNAITAVQNELINYKNVNYFSTLLIVIIDSKYIIIIYFDICHPMDFQKKKFN